MSGKPAQSSITNEMVAKAKQDREYMGRLILKNESLVAYMVHRTARKLGLSANNNIIEQDDLMQLGYFAFINAIKGFDPSKGFKFSTYVCRSIYNELIHYFAVEHRSNGSLNIISLDTPIGSGSDGKNKLTIADVVSDKNIYGSSEEAMIRIYIRSILGKKTKRSRILYMHIHGYPKSLIAKTTKYDMELINRHIEKAPWASILRAQFKRGKNESKAAAAESE